jgi:predicted lactoylglutathione lyase
MSGTYVFINMATSNVAAAREFYSNVGFEINEMFSTAENVFIILSDNVQLILGAPEFFMQLGEQRPFVDATEEKEIGLYARAFFDLDSHKIVINYMPTN